MAVASPSTVGLVAMMTSSTWLSMRANSSLIFSWSGPTPERGEMAPCSTWYRPLYSPALSKANTSLGSSTTQMVDLSRLPLRQTGHSSSSVKLQQTLQVWIFSWASRMAWAKLWASSWVMPSTW